MSAEWKSPMESVSHCLSEHIKFTGMWFSLKKYLCIVMPMYQAQKKPVNIAGIPPKYPASRKF